MTFDEYKKIRAINASCLKQGRKSMLHMHAAMNKEDASQTDAMRWGSLAHKAILEPMEFSELVRIYEGDGDKRSKEWKNFVLENINKSDFIITRQEANALDQMSLAVHSNKWAHDLITGCVPEFTLIWETNEYGKAKGRCDGLGKSVGIIEYKTASTTDEKAFLKQCTDKGLSYDIAAGFYVEGAMNKGLFSQVPQFTFIVQENTFPYDVSVFYAPATMIEHGRNTAVKLAKKYRECEAIGVFPGRQLEPKTLEVHELYGLEEMMDGCEKFSSEYE